MISTILILGFSLVIFFEIAFIILFIKINNNHNKTGGNLIKFYYDIDFEAPNKILDALINEEFDIYTITHIDMNDEYLTGEDQINLITIITTNVYKRMTDAIIANLKLVYNIQDETKDLINIISTRVSLKVMNYARKNNAIKK